MGSSGSTYATEGTDDNDLRARPFISFEENRTYPKSGGEKSGLASAFHFWYYIHSLSGLDPVDKPEGMDILFKWNEKKKNMGVGLIHL